MYQLRVALKPTYRIVEDQYEAKQLDTLCSWEDASLNDSC